MNLAEAALRRQKGKLEDGWESVQPYLRRAYLLRQVNPLIFRRLLHNHTGEEITEYFLQVLAPPASPEEAKIQLLADMVIGLMFPKTEEKIDAIILTALKEINKAYEVIVQVGSGWSSDHKKINPEKRKKAVLEWWQNAQGQLTYLKETHLQDENLYNPGGGQEKRNFIVRMIRKIVEEETGKELTFQKVKDRLEDLKKLQQPLNLKGL